MADTMATSAKATTTGRGMMKRWMEVATGISPLAENYWGVGEEGKLKWWPTFAAFRLPCFVSIPYLDALPASAKTRRNFSAMFWCIVLVHLSS